VSANEEAASGQWVFGYGSLAADAGRGRLATLANHRRCWGVAMDNSRDLPGYKWYRQRATHDRPRAFVAFLDVVPAAGGAVNGLCIPVDAAALERLDARERNYERVEVTDRIEAPPPGRIWTYVGSAAGRRRLRTGVRERRLLISQEYRDDVEHAFRRLGAEQLAAYRASTAPPPDGSEVVALERIDLP
jgi:hypothetical protein